VGPITGRWLKAQTKLAILTVIETSQPQGVSARHSGSLLAIEPRRVVRWQQQSRQGQGLANLSEAAFSTVKRAPAYPGRFLDDTQAKEYFSRCFTWYDTEHYHSGSHPATSPSGTAADHRRTTTHQKTCPAPPAPGSKPKTANRPAKNKQTQNNARRPCSVITQRLRSLIQKRAGCQIKFFVPCRLCC